MYLSNALIDQLQKDAEVEFKLCSQKKMQKSIRDYFIRIHNEAVESTVMATNKPQYVKPEFYDK